MVQTGVSRMDRRWLSVGAASGEDGREVPVASLYAWGEYARLRGINGYDNQTLVMLAVG